MARLTSSQLKRPLRDGPDIVGQFFVAGDAAQRLQVLVGLLLDHVDHVVDGDDADQPVGGVDHGGRDQIVFAEQPRHLFLVVQHRDAAAVFVDQVGQRHRPARAQQRVERHRALPVLGMIDRVDFVEPVRQVRRVAHVVDRLPHGPVRRHRDELGLHPPAGGIFRIQQAALERVALLRRQLLQDLFLVLLVEPFEQFDGVVGFQFANALGDGLRFELLEDFLADGIVDFVERGEVEIGAGQFHQLDAVVGLERRDQIAEIGLVQFRHHRAQQRRIGLVNGAGDFLDEFVANFAIFVAHREALEHRGIGRLGHIDILGHAAPHRFDRISELV